MIPAAKILKSNGIDGDVLVGELEVDIQEINSGEPVYVYFDGLPVPFFVESFTTRGRSRAIVHLTDVDSLEDAEELVGREIFLDAEFEDDFMEDFTGWTLFNRETLVGTVSGLVDIPGNPCLEVGEALVPLHEDLILEADSSRKALVMDLPDGLV